MSKEKKIDAKKIEAPVIKKRKINKASDTFNNETSPSSNRSSSSIKASEDVSASSNIQVNSTSTSTLSLPYSNCPSFPAFLRTVCGMADSVLPAELDMEQGRRAVHRLAGQRVQSGGNGEITKKDVTREMMEGIEEIEEEEVLNNISSDSDGALVMDLSDQDVQ